MSGHSRWTQIKRQKAVTDKKRGNVFTKLGNAISVAVKQGGPDPDSNFKLRLAIDKAREANMPNDNVERAIKRGSGELGGAALEEITYEGFGPGGVAILIQTTTDNRNRTSSTIRATLTKYGGNLGSSNSVAWMFAPKGVIRVLTEHIQDADAFELAAIDAGAEDVQREAEGWTIITTTANLEKAKQALKQTNIPLESAEPELVPTTTVELPPDAATSFQKLLDELEDNEDVSTYYTNAAR